eukprot:gnl/MRDRNA2_/MRDRNA2_58846_c0_seq1.p1 gnl/MRDRNA2_/MRDRNA2_58846_c0~~gnl/MRDRNA2_/MRDRNA2_58846_c0_seq1.p1  ORF type:complete len:1059 (+),score=130.93 gnl/MRDRNA2_/MRDRNA2_58846_c0_seq1:374-3178(+)
MSSNPIGLNGMRHLLRLVAYPRSRLQTLRVEDCYSVSQEVTSGVEGIPSGKNVFQLSFPAHRAILRLLLSRWCSPDTTAEGQSQLTSFAVDKMMRNATLDGKQVQFKTLVRQDKNGIWQVEIERGELIVEICIDTAAFLSPGRVEAKLFLDRITKETRVTLPPCRVVPLLALGRRLRTQDERLRFTEALSRDFILEPQHIAALCRSTGDGQRGFDCCSALSMLLPCVCTSPVDVKNTLAVARAASDFVKVQENCVTFLSLNVENPTGFYKLELSQPCDFYVGQNLLLVSRWEAGIWKERGFAQYDPSQRGNFKCLRNERYGLRPYAYGADEWNLPGPDVLEFDFVSMRRPPTSATAVPEEAWDAYVARISQNYDEKCPLSHVDVLNCLRATSSIIWINCFQLRRLLGELEDHEDRKKAFLCFFFRTVDMPLNEKVLRSQFDAEDRTRLQQALGYVVLFPFFQPENFWCDFPDMHSYEQRRAIQCFTILRKSERATFANPLYDHHGNGNWEAPQFGNMHGQTWDIFENIPVSGGFRTTYKCSKDAVHFQTRRRLAVEWGGWELADGADAVKDLHWWALLDEQSLEVNQFIQYLAARFEDVDVPFKIMDCNGDKSLSMKEFVQSIEKLGYVPTKREQGIRRDKLNKRKPGGKQKGKPGSQPLVKELSQKEQGKPLGKESSQKEQGKPALKESPQKEQEKAFGKQSSEKPVTKKVVQVGDEVVEIYGPNTGESDADPDAMIQAFKDEPCTTHRPISKANTAPSSTGNTANTSVSAQGTGTTAMGTSLSAREALASARQNREVRSARNHDTYKAIFRELNAAQNGSLTLNEWRYMEGVFKEIRLAMQEFVVRLIRHFDTLDNAWEAADENNSGSLDLDEFLTTWSGKHIEGPLLSIFIFLDRDNNGDIEISEWRTLEKLLPNWYQEDTPTGSKESIPE